MATATRVLDWVVGLPGAGKSTCCAAIHADLVEQGAVLTYGSASSADDPAVATEYGAQRVQYWEANRTALIGVYNHSTKPELNDTDNFSPVQRTRVKTLLSDLCGSGAADRIIIEGLLMVQKPFIQRVKDLGLKLRVHVIETDEDECKRRFRARNEAMLGAGRLKFYPTKFNSQAAWDRCAARIQRVVDASDEVVRHACPKACAEFFVESAVPSSPKRRRRC